MEYESPWFFQCGTLNFSDMSPQDDVSNMSPKFPTSHLCLRLKKKHLFGGSSFSFFFEFSRSWIDIEATNVSSLLGGGGGWNGFVYLRDPNHPISVKI